MNLFPILSFNATIEERLEKLIEECQEVIKATHMNASTQEILSEYMDILEVCLTNIHMCYSDIEIEDALKLHRQKMLDRKYEIKSWLEIERL